MAPARHGTPPCLTREAGQERRAKLGRSGERRLRQAGGTATATGGAPQAAPAPHLRLLQLLAQLLHLLLQPVQLRLRPRPPRLLRLGLLPQRQRAAAQLAGQGGKMQHKPFVRVM